MDGMWTKMYIEGFTDPEEEFGILLYGKVLVLVQRVAFDANERIRSTSGRR